MVNLYKWRDAEDRTQRRIAVGRDELFAKCYEVHDGYRTKMKPTLGQLMKFNPYIFENDFEGPIKTTLAEVEKKYGPVRPANRFPSEKLGERPRSRNVMTNVYTWYDDYRGSRMIAVGNQSQFERCYVVHYGFRTPIKPTLGQLMKFNAVDPDTFEGPIRMTLAEVEKNYGPVRPANKPPPEKIGE